jgi:hypothetical protein
MAVLLVQAA